MLLCLSRRCLCDTVISCKGSLKHFNSIQFDYDKRHDAIYGISPSGHAAKQAMVIMVRGILGKWKQASHQHHIVLTNKI